MPTKDTTITVRVAPKLKKELAAIAKSQRRSISNLAEYFLILGKLKYYEQDLASAITQREEKE
jgi:hypothetical protein